VAAGFGVRGLGAVASGADGGVAADEFFAGADGLLTPASGAVFGADDSETGGATTGGVRDDACEAAAASDATGEN